MNVIRGTIGKVSDADAFEFTATHTGQVTFNIQASHDLVANFELEGGTVAADGNRVSFDVQQGQQYRFLIGTADGIGHYQMDASITEGAPATDWGSVDHVVKSNVLIQNGEKSPTSLLRAGAGILTLIGQSGSGAQFQLFNQDMVQQQSTLEANGQTRFDIGAQSGETFFLKAVGQGDFDVMVSNLVSLDNGNLSIHGTDTNDAIVVSTANDFYVQVNSVNYRFNDDSVDSIAIDAGGGYDAVHLYLGATDDNVTIGQGTINASNDQFNLSGGNAEQITVLGGGGLDQLRMEDSAGNDIFYNQGDTVAMLMDGMANYGVGFDFVETVSRSGNDAAYLYGSEGDDKVVSRNDSVRLDSPGHALRAAGFDRVSYDGGGGNDLANIYDSDGDDHFILRPTQAFVTAGDSQLFVRNVGQINAIASTGKDSVVFFDSEGSDRYSQQDNVSSLGDTSGTYSNVARGFDVTTVYSMGGHDVAQVSGSEQSDTVNMFWAHVTLNAGNDYYQIGGFERVNVVASDGGIDVAYMHGTEGSDTAYADANGASITSGGIINRAVGFDSVNVYGKGGNDQARLIGSSGNDRLTANRYSTVLDTEQVTFMLHDFEQQRFDGGEGFDVVALSDFGENDRLHGFGKSVNAQIGNTNIAAENFSFLDAATDLVSNYDMGAADYLFMLDGDWGRRTRVVVIASAVRDIEGRGE